MLAAVMSSLNVTVTAAETDTPVAALAGVVAITTGGVISGAIVVKDQV